MSERRLQTDQLFRYIDANAARFVEELRRLIRQPTIAAEEVGIEEGAALVKQMMEEIGIEAQIIEAQHSPFVFGRLASRSGDKTLLVTSHYDVVPPGSLSEWEHDPFAAELRGGDVFGRGAADAKGNLMAGLKAVETLLQTQGDVPINFKFLIDGDDEADLGDYPGFVERHKELLRCDAVLLIDAGFTRDGNSPVHAGNAGCLTVDLQVKTGSKDPYIIWTQLIPDAAYRLTWALSSLKGQDERVQIDGFYDDVYRPMEADLNLLQTYPWSDEGEMAFWGIDGFVTGVQGAAAVRRLLFEPTCSICGFVPGLPRDDAGTLVPSQLGARVNFHLVPYQDPDDVLAKLRTHLDRRGFDDVQIEVYRKLAPVAGSADSEIGRAVVQAAAQVGVSTYLVPYSFELGYAWSSLGRQLGVDGALVGIADPDRRAHFANEHISIPYYVDGIKWMAASFLEYGRT